MADDLTHRAEEAKNLLSNELLAEALTEVRMDALVALGEVDATDTKEILRLQAIAHCLQEVRDKLEAAIIRTGERDGGTVMSINTRKTR